MELTKIERLIEKYENAETTLQEENVLKDYFSKDSVAPHLEQYKAMFNYFSIAKSETLTKPIVLSKTKKNYKWLSIAASITLLFSVYIGQQEYKKVQEKKKAMEIYAQVSESLKLLSTNLKKGENAVATLYTYENTAKKILK
jgi:hypothetical protein